MQQPRRLLFQDISICDQSGTLLMQWWWWWSLPLTLLFGRKRGLRGKRRKRREVEKNQARQELRRQTRNRWGVEYRSIDVEQHNAETGTGGYTSCFCIPGEVTTLWEGLLGYCASASVLKKDGSPKRATNSSTSRVYGSQPAFFKGEWMSDGEILGGSFWKSFPVGQWLEGGRSWGL